MSNGMRWIIGTGIAIVGVIVAVLAWQLPEGTFHPGAVFCDLTENTGKWRTFAERFWRVIKSIQNFPVRAAIIRDLHLFETSTWSWLR